MRILCSVHPHIRSAVLVITMTIALAAPAAAWQTAHGDPDNTGTVDVPTAPAANPVKTVPRLGIMPGAAPVIASHGTLYIGNMKGTLRSFGPDGGAGWSTDILGFLQIRTSPALGNDGSVYVVGEATIRDNTTSPATQRNVIELLKYNANGGAQWRGVWPDQTWSGPASAPPNILTIGGKEVVLVASGDYYGARLTAFDGDSGLVMRHHIVTARPTDLSTAEFECFFCSSVSLDLGGKPKVDSLPALRLPFPAIAIVTPPGDAPLILVSDGFQDLVGYNFDGEDFLERFRVHENKRYLTSPPLAWPDGHAMINTAAADADIQSPQVMYAGPGFSTNRAAGPYSLAPATELGGSRHALVAAAGGLTIMSGVTTLQKIHLPGESVAAAAASRTHIFVSTASALHTFDKATLKKVASFAWTKGGMSQPVIGPQGHVYAIADDVLHVFPAPVSGGKVVNSGTVPGVEPAGKSQPGATDGAVARDTILPSDILPAEQTQPGATGSAVAKGTILQSDILPAEQAQPGASGGAVTEGTILQSDILPATPLAPAEIPSASRQTYKPPVLASGNRLFACLSLNGDDCGNSQMREVAETFCRTQGFDRAEDLDVDSRKVVAETLDGRFCSKKKCRVFDQIVCRR